MLGWLILPLLLVILMVLRVVKRRAERGSTPAAAFIRASRFVGVAVAAGFVFSLVWGIYVLAQLDVTHR